MRPSSLQGAVLIVAGSQDQANYWAAQWKITNWIYASDERMLRGWVPKEIRYCGTWRRELSLQMWHKLEIVESRMEHK